MRKIRISELQEDMILPYSVYCDYSYEPTLNKGTKLTKERLAKVKELHEKGYCFIQEPEEIDDIKMEQLSKIEDKQTQKTFLDTFIASKSINKNLECGNPLNIELAYETADTLVEQIASNNNLLVQLASVNLVDEYSLSHMINVGIYAGSFAKSIQCDYEFIKEACLAGLLHDLGKAKIPEEILKKPGKLTDEEFETIKKHPEYGHEMIKSFSGISKNVSDAVIYHHERINGTGYPYGVTNLGILTQIISLTDVYDALTSNRCYRSRIKPDEAIEIIMGSSTNKIFDVELVRSFVKNITIYSIGTNVVLSTGEEGYVIKIHPKFPLRPTVKIVKDAKGNKLKTEKHTDLMWANTVFITRVIY